MKKLFIVLVALCSVVANAQNVTVLAKPSGQLVTPTNFFRWNSNQIVAIVSHITNGISGGVASNAVTQIYSNATLIGSDITKLSIRYTGTNFTVVSNAAQTVQITIPTNATVDLSGLQAGSANLTNWSGVGTNEVFYVSQLSGVTNSILSWVSGRFITNYAGVGTNLTLYASGGLANSLMVKDSSDVGRFYILDTSWIRMNLPLYLDQRTNDANKMLFLDANLQVVGSNLTDHVYPINSGIGNIDTNKVATRDWVDTQLSFGEIYYNSTNVSTNGFDTNAFTFIKNSPIPASFSRTNFSVTNNQYIGSVITTNLITTLQAPVSVNAYLGRSGGSSLTVQPEIYYTYDRTNLLGDWNGAAQTITTGTNLYQWTITFPTVTATNVTGFYVVRRFKVASQVGTPNVVIYGGTNTESHIHIPATGTSGSSTFDTNQANITLTNGLNILTNGTLTLYGSGYGDASNYKLGRIQQGANSLDIGTYAAGTGASTSNGMFLNFATWGTNRWFINPTGQFGPVTEGTRLILDPTGYSYMYTDSTGYNTYIVNRRNTVIKRIGNTASHAPGLAADIFYLDQYDDSGGYSDCISSTNTTGTLRATLGDDFYINTRYGGSYADRRVDASSVIINLGYGTTPPSGTIAGGNGGDVRILLKSGAAGSGGAAAGRAGQFRLFNLNTNIQVVFAGENTNWLGGTTTITNLQHGTIDAQHTYVPTTTNLVWYIDLSLPAQTIDITNVGLTGITFHTTNRPSSTNFMRTSTVRIRQTATNSLPLTFNSGWTNFVGNAPPTALATNVWGILSISCWGTDETNVLAGYAVQPY